LIEILLAEWKGKQRMQNERGSKLNYFCRNETKRKILEARNRRKKAVITYYLDTSPEKVRKSDGR